MKKYTTELIEEVESLKDLLFYLRGYIKAKNEDMENIDIKQKHIIALEECIYYIQKKELR